MSLKNVDKYPFQYLPRKKPSKNYLQRIKENDIYQIWWFTYQGGHPNTIGHYYWVLLVVNNHIVPYGVYFLSGQNSHTPLDGYFESVAPMVISHSVRQIIETDDTHTGKGPDVEMMAFIESLENIKKYKWYHPAHRTGTTSADGFLADIIQWFFKIYGGTQVSGGISKCPIDKLYRGLKAEGIIEGQQFVNLGTQIAAQMTQEELDQQAMQDQMDAAKAYEEEQERIKKNQEMMGNPFGGVHTSPVPTGVDGYLWWPGSYEETSYHRYTQWDGLAFYGPNNCKVNSRQSRIYREYNVIVYNMSSDFMNQYYFVYPMLQTSVMTAEKKYTKLTFPNWDNVKGSVIQRWNGAEAIRYPKEYPPSRTYRRYSGFQKPYEKWWLSPSGTTMNLQNASPIWIFVEDKEIALWVGKQAEYNSWAYTWFSDALSAYFATKGVA